MHTYIVKDPEILSGKPVIKGTRIPVARIIHLLKEGFTIENISDQYPHLKLVTIKKVVDEVISNLDNPHYAA